MQVIFGAVYVSTWILEIKKVILKGSHLYERHPHHGILKWHGPLMLTRCKLN